ncbi:MAG: TlpA family protein disulfide reductase [Nitrospinae bacterium]|nr:TlpA family protein disulfide reductase [Nitrospinota bacterium]
MEATLEQNKQASIAETFNLNKIILLVAAALVLRAFFVYEEPLVPLKVGDHVPDFHLSLFNGKQLNQKDIMGAPHVFFFYANWCPCANFSIQFFNKAHVEYSGKGIKFVAVGFQDKKDALESFIQRHQVPFTAGPDEKSDVSKLFGIATPPTTVFVNSDGSVASIFSGKIKKYSELTEYLEKLL